MTTHVTGADIFVTRKRPETRESDDQRHPAACGARVAW